MNHSDPSVGGRLAALTKKFAAAGLANPALDARLLVMHAGSLDHADLIASPQHVLDDDQLTRLDDYAAQRLARRPVSKIIGIKGFFGHDFIVSDDVLDPRPDTETLVEAAIKKCAALDRPIRVLDIGTGSGAIILSVLAAFGQATGIATDLSAAALDNAANNARQLGVKDRVEFVHTNWCEGVEGKFDVIVSNPPYIASDEIGRLEPEVKTFDPRLALDGGKDGLAAYRAILQHCLDRLASDGCLLLEVGHDQADAVVSLVQASSLTGDKATICVLKDLAGQDRVVVLDCAKNPYVEKRVGNQQQTG